MITAGFAAAVAVTDLCARAKLRLSGIDRVRFVNGQVSNDVRQATEGSSIYTCVMTIKGKMCADAFIHATADALWIDAEEAVRESLAARLEKYIVADDVNLEDLSEETGLLHFLPLNADAGPAAMDSLRALAGSMSELRCVRSLRYGQPGLDIFGSTAAVGQARARLAAGVALLDAAALETRRILAGVPRWGAELDENTMPAEAGLEERAVSYSKGCYIGQEVVSRVRSVGHVNRHLRGLRGNAGDGLRAGYRLYPVEDAEGREVGRITSVAMDPANPGFSIALAFVRRGWDSAGNVLTARPAPINDAAANVTPAPVPSRLPLSECRVVVSDLPFT